MATKRFAVVSLLALGLSVTGSATSLRAQGGVEIAARDQLVITVAGSAELSRKVTVDVDGSFDYPYLGRVKAAGLTTRALAADLKTRLHPDYAINPTVTVDLEQSMSKHFSIIGE